MVNYSVVPNIGATKQFSFKQLTSLFIFIVNCFIRAIFQWRIEGRGAGRHLPYTSHIQAIEMNETRKF